MQRCFKSGELKIQVIAHPTGLRTSTQIKKFKRMSKKGMSSYLKKGNRYVFPGSRGKNRLYTKVNTCQEAQHGQNIFGRSIPYKENKRKTKKSFFQIPNLKDKEIPILFDPTHIIQSPHTRHFLIYHSQKDKNISTLFQRNGKI